MQTQTLGGYNWYLLLYFQNIAFKYILVEKETDESSIPGESEIICRLLMSIRLHCFRPGLLTHSLAQEGTQQPTHPFRKHDFVVPVKQLMEEGKSWCLKTLLCIQKTA